MSNEIANIKKFLDNCSVEVTPGGAKKIENFRDLLRPGTTVFVTFLPGSDFNDTVATVKRLSADGMKPVPHFAARSIPNLKFFEENLKILQGEAKVEEAERLISELSRLVAELKQSLEKK